MLDISLSIFSFSLLVHLRYSLFLATVVLHRFLHLVLFLLFSSHVQHSALIALSDTTSFLRRLPCMPLIHTYIVILCVLYELRLEERLIVSRFFLLFTRNRFVP